MFHAPHTFALPLPTLPLLGLRVVSTDADTAIAALLAPGRRRGHFLNAHCVNVMHNDGAYFHALQTADIVLPDGIGVELAARMTGQRIAANLNGTDLVPALLDRAAAQGLSVFLFGGAPGTAPAAAHALRTRIPGLTVAGTRDGFDGARDPDAAIAAINGSGADIVLVAMGVPLQDLWLAQHAHRLDARLTLGVGACLDFLAGNVARAPRILRRARLEWAWRLALEPRRLARRYLLGNVLFLARAARHALGQRRRTPRRIGTIPAE